MWWLNGSVPICHAAVTRFESGIIPTCKEMLVPSYKVKDKKVSFHGPIFWFPFDASACAEIPVQPIGYGDAQRLLAVMGGEEVPEEWRGRLPNITYTLGPDLAQDYQV